MEQGGYSQNRAWEPKFERCEETKDVKFQNGYWK